jgi:hypothetical protein
MRQLIYLDIVVEDYLTKAIILKIIDSFHDKFCAGTPIMQNGSGYIKKKIISFNKAANYKPYLIITDLDQYECPPLLIKEWLPYPKNPNLIFRIAVKEIETWLLADRSNLARYLKISIDKIPIEVESIIDPKNFLINLARKSPERNIREAIVPRYKGTAKIGPEYNDCLAEFVQNKWMVVESAKNSISLKKTLEALEKFKPSVQKKNV